jgi:hypothetical protein
LSFTAQLGSAKIALALLLRVIFFQKSLAQGLSTSSLIFNIRLLMLPLYLLGNEDTGL